jgi:hypothetical protein
MAVRIYIKTGGITGIKRGQGMDIYSHNRGKSRGIEEGSGIGI